MRDQYNCLWSSSKTWKWKRLDKWRMQRPQADFPLGYFPYHKVKLKREQSRGWLWRALAEFAAGGGCHGMLCVYESALCEWGLAELMDECGTGPKKAWRTWRWSGAAASRDHSKNLMSLAEHCSFWLSSAIVNFAFPFVLCDPAFALQVANVLKESLKVNSK